MSGKILLILSSVLLYFPIFGLSQSPVQRKKFTTIVIDPGHGGKDHGAKGLVTNEAALCLQISKKLGSEIKRQLPGIRVLFTRTTNEIPGNKGDANEGLRYRAEFANRTSADFFISIHCNSAGKEPGGWYEKKAIGYKKIWVLNRQRGKRVRINVPVYKKVFIENKIKGTETYLWAARESAEKSEMVGTREEFENNADQNIQVQSNNPVLKALALVYTRNYFAKSLKMANLVQMGFEKNGRINRGVKQRNQKGIWVLHATGMPSILIEAGFITNKKEESYLISNRGQLAIARTITKALKQYINFQVREALNLVSGGNHKHPHFGKF